MDYEIKATSRHDLRLYARLFRSVCGFSENEVIDPVQLLDRLPDLEGFEDVRYEIVYNNNLPGNVPAQCITTDEGYLIQIKESVYLGADGIPERPMHQKSKEIRGLLSVKKQVSDMVKMHVQRKKRFW